MWEKMFKLKEHLAETLVMASAGGIVGILMLSPEWSVWGVLAGFMMGFVFVGLAVTATPYVADRFDGVVIGGIGGGIAAAVGWWIIEPHESLALWATAGAIVGALFLSHCDNEQAVDD